MIWSNVKKDDTHKLHNKNNPLLIGVVREDAKITIIDMKLIKGSKLGEKQINLFDNIK